MGSSIPGNSCRTTKCCAPTSNTGCIVRVPGECVFYTGANIAGPNIFTGDTFNTVINNFNTYISTITSLVTNANNGLSLTSTVAVLGQDVGQINNPAGLTSRREIPLNGFSIGLSGNTANNMLGVGIAIPQCNLHVSRQGTTLASSAIPAGGVGGMMVSGHSVNSIDIAIVDSTDTAGGHVSLQLARSRGTLDVPTDVISGDSIGFINAYAYSSGNMRTRSSIIFSVDGTVSGTSIPMDIRFRTGSSSALERVRISSSGNMGVRTMAPTAYLHLGAGTATAETAPLKFIAGTNLTVPENGAMEFDGTNLYITIAGVRRTINVT